ncbi:MAG: lamin tail domain-containing protein, partial [Ignavibacteriae bacterium]|nr:lamin tail domain-containing protein [Ignavibacteriota bacterium]
LPDVVLNEFLPNPVGEDGTVMPNGEWVELYNNSNFPVNIKNWKISDSTTQSNPILITENNKIIGANDYIVIAKNNTIVSNHRQIDTNKIVYLTNLPGFNDDADVIMIYDYINNVIDRVAYKSNWGGNNLKNSLERVSPNRPSNDSTNWATSLDCEYSSPTRANSLSNLTSYSRNDLIVNEIMYDPLTISCEWIEFYNSSSKFLNLTGWRLNVSTSFYNLFDTCNIIINPGQYVIIAKDTTIFNRFSVLKNPDPSRRLIFSNNLYLSNEGAMLRIMDALNNVIDSVYYNPKWHNSNLPDTKGYSLERINPQFNANDRSNWNSCTALLGGTPGAKNSIFTSNSINTNTVSVSPNPFSPDGDGYEDFTIIKYKLKQNISQLRVKVYDVKGRMVRTLLNNQLSGSEGQIIFDGKNDNGEKLRIGIYILFIEAINDVGGTVEQVKATVVVASKL